MTFTISMTPSRLRALRGLYDLQIIRARMGDPDYGSLVTNGFAFREYLRGPNHADKCDYRLTVAGREFAQLAFEQGGKHEHQYR